MPLFCAFPLESARLHKIDALAAYLGEIASATSGDVLPPPATSIVATLTDSRSPFAKTDSSWDPLPYLGVETASTYVEPRLLMTGCPLAPSVSSGPPPASGLRQRGQRKEILAHLRRWDDSGRLLLVDAADVPAAQRGELFPVFKSGDEDRIVFNRIPRNQLERHVGGFSSLTPAAPCLVELELPPDCEAHVWSEDLSDFYPAFQAGETRGCTNALGLPLPPTLFEGTEAFKRLARRCAKEKRPLPTQVLPCNLGLVMGDLNANDYAVESHMKLLQEHGSFRGERAVLNRRPFPRGPIIEGVVVDDHFAVAIDETGSEHNAALAQDSFNRARAAYNSVGLRYSEKKARHGFSDGVLVGAELLGKRGQVGAERAKRFALARLSLRMALLGRTTGGLLRSSLSTWLFALMFRRPMLCVLHALYRALPAVEEDNVVFDLKARGRDELGYLAVLSPLMVTNLRAGWSDRVVATDASPFAEGAVAARVPTPLLREMWRRRDRRGHYTWIPGREAEALRAGGHDEEMQELEDASEQLTALGAPLAEKYDFVELCCGPTAPLCVAMSEAGLVVGPRIELKLSALWDLSAERVIAWVLHLVNAGRVWYVHSGVPCTTFSIARHPPLRSAQKPWGFDEKESETALGNLLFRVALCLMLAVKRRGWGLASHEHPLSAHSWHVGFWHWLERQHDCGFVRFDMCAFGAPHFKPTRLARVRGAHLDLLARTCDGSHVHERLEGSRTTKASLYPAELCLEWARLTAAARARDEDGAPPPDDLAPPQAQGRFEKLWLNELNQFLNWRVVWQKRKPLDEHINVKEIKMALGQCCREARRRPCCRHLSLLDSRVSIGALAKGRSAAPSLNGPMREALPDIVGYDAYPGYDFLPTRGNFSDDPSRLKTLRPTGGGPVPAWLPALLGGDPSAFDAAASLPLQPRACSEWARLTLKLLAPDGGWVCDLCETGIEPNPGPRPQALPLHKRPAVSLVHDRGLTARTRSRRQRLLFQLDCWLQAQELGPLDDLLQLAPGLIARVLACYGQALYDGGRARGDFSECINGVVDRARHLRRQLGAAWDVAFAWKVLTPEANHVAMPETVMLACCSLALIWGWYELAGLVMLGFLGMMRPGEIYHLHGSDILLPSELLSAHRILFVRIGRPKMRRLGAKREHVRIDDVEVVLFFEALMRDRDRSLRIFPESAASLRARFGALVSFFSIPFKDGAGLTLASLRPGGATFWYARTDATEWVRFRGRWASSRMLETYIQEVNARSVMPALHPEARRKLQRFASAAPALLTAATQLLGKAPDAS